MLNLLTEDALDYTYFIVLKVEMLYFHCGYWRPF